MWAMQYNLKNEIKNETTHKIFDRNMTLKADNSLFYYLSVLDIQGWKKGLFDPAK